MPNVTKIRGLNLPGTPWATSACCGRPLPLPFYYKNRLPEMRYLSRLRTIVGGGHAVAQLIEALHYKPEGREFDSRWCHWNFSLTQSFRPHSGPEVDSASNRNEYQEYFLGGKGGRCVGLTTSPLSCADCLEIWKPQIPGTLRASPGLQWDCLTLTYGGDYENCRSLGCHLYFLVGLPKFR